MGRLPRKTPEQIAAEKQERAKLEEAMHKVVFLCQVTGIPKRKVVGIVRDKCLTGYKEARGGVERYWDDNLDFSKVPGRASNNEKK